ncbi:MAG: pyruvate ferredoxin oxidoreductase [Bacteroidetes bacterium]|nr:MAG: pyruvate ferredoxin oxidoreductase [Bacteroidota bacterium]
MSNKKLFISGDEAVAIGAKLSRPNVISAYPITPQTVTVERLSEMVESGELNAEYMHVESEHSAMSAAMGVSAVGARAFTATSSQGLLYMAEGLHYASGGRYPIVMMNANRSLALPWSIYGDQRDSLSLLDSGWIQVYVEDAQEALDMIIQAYKIAENKDILTPFMVNLDGFVLTHTYELVEIPEQEKVDEFLPPFQTPNKMSFEEPKNMAFSTTPADNLEYKYQQNRAMFNSISVINDVDKEFGDKFERYYGGMVQEYRCDDAEVVMLTLGSITGTVRMIVDKLRGEGKKVGLLKIRYMRPFPEKEIIKLAEKVKAVGVVEKDISFGYEGTVFTNVNSALSKIDNAPLSLNFLCGMGGRDVSKSDIYNMFISLFKAADGEKQKRIQFINMGVETDE